jgi:hypothetical protein
MLEALQETFAYLTAMGLQLNDALPRIVNAAIAKATTRADHG